MKTELYSSETGTVWLGTPPPDFVLWDGVSSKQQNSHFHCDTIFSLDEFVLRCVHFMHLCMQLDLQFLAHIVALKVWIPTVALLQHGHAVFSVQFSRPHQRIQHQKAQ